MKILLANKYWYLRGGAERYTFELARLLERGGHEIVPFAMRDPKNVPTAFNDFFVSPVLTDRIRLDAQGLRTAGRMLWSFEAAIKFRALLREAKPDVIHVQNIYHQISPSILRAAEKEKILTVMTLHDYHLVSPNYAMFDRGAVVEPSKDHPFRDTYERRLIDGSLLKSALSAFEGWLHAKLDAYRHVRTFIAPSLFLRNKCIEYGIDPRRIEVVPHFIDLEGREPAHDSEAFVLYVGRLSPEKGVELLLRAAEEARAVKIVIVGDGPDGPRLRRMAEERKLGNVTFAGALHGADLEYQFSKARIVVIPSQSYEVFGLTALEAYAHGKPVVASRIGGLPEVVREGETGLLFEPTDPSDLAAKLSVLMNDPDEARRLGLQGRRLAETEYAPEIHLKRLFRVYGM